MQENEKEEIAAAVHDSWARWMTHLFEKSQTNNDGSVTIPRKFVHRWNRQIQTPYHELSQREKKSDQREVERYLKILNQENKN